MEGSLDQLSAILPIDFFQITLHAHPYLPSSGWKKRHRLPDLSKLLCDTSFAAVSMGIRPEGLHFHIAFFQPFSDCQFPSYRRGDSVELFIDTRDLKSAGFLTKFCHHFVFFPTEVDGIRGQEVTAFRTDDRHELCDPGLLHVESTFQRRSYEMEIAIPADCLEGYDPAAFDRMGLTYRINRKGAGPQHFALSSRYLAVEKESKRWSTVNF